MRKKRSGQYLSTRVAAAASGPTSRAELELLVSDEASCLRYLAALRWPEGYRCPHCDGCGNVYGEGEGRICCGDCRTRSTAVSGTPLQPMAADLPTDLRALWAILEERAEPAAVAARLELTNPLPWLEVLVVVMRRAIVQPLAGRVELVCVPVELVSTASRLTRRHVMVAMAAAVRDGHIVGLRLARLDSVDPSAVVRFVRATVEPGSCLRTGTWWGYERLPLVGYRHIVCHGGEDNCDGNPLIAARVASSLRLWLWSVGGLDNAQLDLRLDEFVFRFEPQLARAAPRSGALFRHWLKLALRSAAPSVAATAAS